MRSKMLRTSGWLNAIALICSGWVLLAVTNVTAQSIWTPIPKSDAANRILQLVKASQPAPSDLPGNSTYNYIWAQNMMAWMVAERSGLVTSNECCARLCGLLNRVANWKTYHGFYYDAYDASTGLPTSDNVYFQGWWIWALLIARENYPCAAGTANMILSRFNYDAAGMASSNHQFLVADRNARTGVMSYYIRPTGDIAGELRTAVICYTFLTGDITPWRITNSPTFICVGGQKLLSVYHHFTFDPFYVHSCFPEVGYFQKSYNSLVQGADVYRWRNGMTFYATRMEPLQAWHTDPATWPNTEHRVAKPWIAWLTDSNAPVMKYAWVPHYGVVQYFDNWNFYWGYGDVTHADSKVIGGPSHGKFEADLHLEVLPDDLATDPPRLKKIQLYAEAAQGTTPLIIKLNGSRIAQIKNSHTFLPPITITLTNPPVLMANNKIQLETNGTNIWRVGKAPTPFHYMKWSDDNHDSSNVPPIAMTVWVTGQRVGWENPYAFLCRAAGGFGDYSWLLLAQANPKFFGNHLVAWVGNYSANVKYAHVIYNVADSSEHVTYTLSPWEKSKHWKVVHYDHQSSTISCTQTGDAISWTQPAHSCLFVKPE